MTRSIILALLLILHPAAPAHAATGTGNPHAPDTPEPGSVEAIARDTTETRFVNPWVSYVPDSKSVPTPTAYLGHVVGAAGELTRTEKIYGYLRALDKASDRVKVEVIGKTEEGREILLVVVSDETGIRELGRLKEATRLLADPRLTNPEQAEKLISESRPIYYFNAGLHSMETGSPEMVMELAYRLAVSDQPMIRRIRENVVTLINPVSEPDGRDKYVDWFYRYLKGKTDFDNLPELNPPYWGHYVFHDNNRDTHQKALELTRAVHRMYYDYHPTVMHDLHESIPLLHTWNGTGPYNENLDPIVINEWLEMSFAEMTALTGQGMPGVWTWGFGESWGLHYLDSVANNHNAIGRGYETFGNHTAETVERRLRSSENRYVGKPVTTKEWYRAWPPDKKFMWSLRDNTNYMESGCLAILDWSARNAKELLRDFYRKGYNSWKHGVDGKPFAFVIPEDQGDRRRVAQMINLLMSHRIEVSRAADPISVKEGEFAAGSYVVRLDQPYRNYAVDLLTPQKFPTDSAYEPYDDVSWALPVHYGVEAKRIDDEAITKARLSPLTGDVTIKGRVTGSGPVHLAADTGQEALMAARFRLSSLKVEVAEKPFTIGETKYPAGSFIVPEQKGARDAVEKVATELGIDFNAVSADPDVARHEAKVPRIAVWHPWADTESIGWIRLVLDAEKIPYDYIRDEEIRAGNLKARWDIILYGNVYLRLKDQIHGIDPKFGPMPYTRTPQYPSHGVPDASEDITGGIGWTGMASLARFLDDGGLMITLANGSALPLEGGLVRNVRRAGGEPFTPGVELRAKFTNTDHPLSYGYPQTPTVFRQGYTVYAVEPNNRRFMVMQWGTRPIKDEREDEEKPEDEAAEDTASDEDKKADDTEMVVSGGAKNLDDLEGYPAILDLPAGAGAKGRVLAYNFNPIHRDLNRSDYRFLWNAIINWNALPEAVP